MAKLTLGIAAFLILMSGVFWLAVTVAEGEAASVTALLPAAIGFLLGVCGALALKPSLRMHAMHAGMLVALLALLAVVGEAFFRPGAMEASGIAMTAKVLTALALLVYLVLGIRSFIAARRARDNAA